MRQHFPIGAIVLALGTGLPYARAQAPEPVRSPAARTSAQPTEALHLLACLHEQSGQDAQARRLFEQVANEWPAARFNLGVLMAQGRGGDLQRERGQELIAAAWREQRLPQAGAWLLEAAIARRDTAAVQELAAALEPLAHPRADLVLARMYFAQGRHERALALTQRAAQAGQPRAERLVALLGRNGGGLPRDASESASWQLIAEAMLSPSRPTDSVLQTAVRNSLQADDAGRTALRDTPLACDVPRPAPPPVVAAASPAAGNAAPAGASTTAAKPELPVFRVAAGQSLRAAWLAYGRATGVPTQWAGLDVSVRGGAEARPESLEALGGLIVESARAIGLPLKLQIQEDARGAVQAMRLAPN